MGRVVVAFLAGAALATVGTAIAADAMDDQPMPEQIAMLRDRVAYLERGAAAQGREISAVHAQADATQRILAGCLRLESFRWERVNGRQVLVRIPARGSRMWVAFMPTSCTQYAATRPLP